MHTETIKLPKGHKLIKHDESITGYGVALARVSSKLFAIHSVMPNGFVDDTLYESNLVLANGKFESRLMGNC
jgi:hypothetical protein